MVKTSKGPATLWCAWGALLAALPHAVRASEHSVLLVPLAFDLAPLSVALILFTVVCSTTFEDP